MQLNFLKAGDKSLQFVSDGNINNMMERSGIESKWLYSRFNMAYYESTGGKMDFALRYLGGNTTKANNDIVGGFYLFGNSSTAFNVQDAGNFLWGHSMNRLGFDYSTSQFFSQLNEWFRDSDADQRAIRSGFHYRVTTQKTIYFENNNGIIHKP